MSLVWQPVFSSIVFVEHWILELGLTCFSNWLFCAACFTKSFFIPRICSKYFRDWAAGMHLVAQTSMAIPHTFFGVGNHSYSGVSNLPAHSRPVQASCTSLVREHETTDRHFWHRTWWYVHPMRSYVTNKMLDQQNWSTFSSPTLPLSAGSQFWSLFLQSARIVNVTRGPLKISNDLEKKPW